MRLVAADPLARAALASRLAEAGLIVGLHAGEPPAGNAAGDEADVLLLDLGLDASVALDQLASSDLPCLALAPDEESGVAAISAGARGVLLRGGDPAELGPALRAVAAGIAAVDPAILAALAPQRELSPAGELTPREHEVLQLVAQGLSNRAIAGRLGISEHTAKFHVNAILGKLGVQRRSEAVARAARLGLVVF